MNKKVNGQCDWSKLYSSVCTFGFLSCLSTGYAVAQTVAPLTPNITDPNHYVQGAHTGPGPVVQLSGGDLLITFTLPVAGPVDLTLVGYDIDFPTEALIEGDGFVAFLSRGINNQHSPPETISLGNLSAGAHQYTIRNDRNPNWKWGVSELLITASTDGGGESDTFTLAELSCVAGEIAKFDGTAWACADDVSGGSGGEGSQGPAGPQGEAGPAGAEGPMGPQGSIGPIGPQGPEGPQGETGPAGNDGQDGADGLNAADDPDLAADLLELFTRMAAIEAASQNSYRIGDTGPGGGIVFYLEPDTGGVSGLEAAPVDQVASVWCNTNIDIPGIANINNLLIPDPNSGAYNTDLIINDCGETSAAGRAAAYVWPNGQTDGYLPNYNELSYLQIYARLVNLFRGGFYWTSSEQSGSTKYCQFDAVIANCSITSTQRIRAVRSF